MVHRIALLLLVLVLVACGGGASGGGDEETTNGYSSSSPDFQPLGGGPTPPESWQEDMLTRLNILRADGSACHGGGRYGLKWNQTLADAAYIIAHDLDEWGWDDGDNHVTHEGLTLADRLADVGYSYTSAGENVASGYTTVAAVMTGWEFSTGHCKNMTSTGFTEVGFARVGNAWAQVFGAPSGGPKPVNQ